MAALLEFLEDRVWKSGLDAQFVRLPLVVEPGVSEGGLEVQAEVRHQHDGEDDLTNDRGSTGGADGHHLVNNSGKDAWYLEVGDRSPGDAALYPDHDLRAEFAPAFKFVRRDGTPY